MAHYNTVFHTLAKILPRHEIDRLDKKYGQGDRRRKTSRYVQLIVMLMVQILGLKSLREIGQAQKSKQKRLYHLGVKSPISRSALSRMNDEWSADFFKDVFQQMLQSCRALAPGSQFKLPGVNSLILMDATTIQLCLAVFLWATYMQSKGALKLHFGLNDDGYLPEFMVATTGKVHEINVAISLDYQPGSMICMDRGCTDYDQYVQASPGFADTNWVLSTSFTHTMSSLSIFASTRYRFLSCIWSSTRCVTGLKISILSTISSYTPPRRSSQQSLGRLSLLRNTI